MKPRVNPCPICGNKPKMWHDQCGHDLYYYYCTKDGIEGNWKHSIKEAREAWNSRDIYDIKTGEWRKF